MSETAAPDMSPLEREIRKRIAAAGPMPVGAYMALCLSDPQHGYYVTRNPIGAAGDFTTAPEVSQMFGELIGLWAVAMWRQMGAPDPVRIVELGPGRGTMISDAMRAAKVAPDFITAASVHLVEVSPALETLQQETLAEAGVAASWHRALADVPPGPSIILANEFFDALPVNQAVKQADGWHLRCVTVLPEGEFGYTAAPDPLPLFERTLPDALRAAADGEVFEWRSDIEAMELGRRLTQQPSAALVIDYGHVESACGETLQAVQRHNFADPLALPGQVDLTAHVDFEALARGVESMGAVAWRTIEQGEFLRRLGIETRAKTLRANMARAKAHDIDAALARLTGHGRTDMGTLFKAAAFTHRKLGAPPAFA
jgi:NADH dehydrogenase [ubiquinone] 1 alpha subcomplex assembly factor 7